MAVSGSQVDISPCGTVGPAIRRSEQQWRRDRPRDGSSPDKTGTSMAAPAALRLTFSRPWGLPLNTTGSARAVSRHQRNAGVGRCPARGKQHLNQLSGSPDLTGVLWYSMFPIVMPRRYIKVYYPLRFTNETAYSSHQKAYIEPAGCRHQYLAPS